jgi:predicted dehydrogenase
MERLRAAILGYGRSGGTMHAGAYDKNRDAFDLVAVCDIDPESRRRAQERFGCTVYADYRQMLAQERLDLVSVVTRSDQHAAMACDCLGAGVNVLVTKPWAVTAAEAEGMIAAAQRAGRHLLPWLPARWGSVFTRLQALLGQGVIGDVFLIRRAESSFATRCDWQTEKRYGGGYLLNWGPHVVDPPILLGGGRPKTVFGRLRQTINPGDTEDVVFAVVTLANGVVVQAEYTVSAIELPTWFIQGTRGSIEVRGTTIRVVSKTPAQPADPTRYADMKAASESTTEEKVGGAVYGDEVAIYAEIAQALRGQRPYPVTTAAALELTRVFDAVRTSQAEDRLVCL